VAVVDAEFRETDDGLTVHPIFAVEDETAQDRLTVPLNPPEAWTVIADVPVCPDEEIVTLVGLADTE